VIVEDATLLESAERSQVIESKCKKVISVGKKRHWPLKKAKKKYYRDNAVKMGVLTPMRDVYILGRIV